MRAKPDITGHVFGWVTVLGKGSRTNNGTQRYACQCSCGKLFERTKAAFLKNAKAQASCGCRKGAIAVANKGTTKPPILKGQQFGMLTMLEKLDESKRGQCLYLWNCEHCGQNFKDVRWDIEYGKRKSCGCYGKRYQSKINNGRKPKDITGQRFGKLVALRPADTRAKEYKGYSKPLWLLQCDCGGKIELTVSRLGLGLKRNCGDRSKHQWGCKYPPMPSPMPSDVANLIIKYQRFVRTKYDNEAYGVEDARRDRLIRSAWILTYRRANGEAISELHEKRYINKIMYCATIHSRYLKRLELKGNHVYNGNKLTIKGSGMTNPTFLDYPVSESETPEIKLLPIIRKARQRFKRF